MSRRSCKRPLPSVVAQTVLRSGLVLLLVPELAVVLLELPGLSLDFQYWLYPRQRPDLLVQPPREVSAGGRGGSVGDVLQGRRTSSGFTADAAVASDSEPFVDDGMFDPRRDYWGDRSSGSTTSSSAPASQNWASGGCSVLCCVCPCLARRWTAVRYVRVRGRSDVSTDDYTLSRRFKNAQTGARLLQAVRCSYHCVRRPK